ncbi:ATP-binding protein [Streptomyces apocyni]|uniref:ATP-binding protein n=1 Tax=Streptomyces apocyni TaxID=2654677 RepID=UPI002D7EE3D8|nr:ATP-binding protein [Streptomyces apocyni]
MPMTPPGGSASLNQEREVEWRLSRHARSVGLARALLREQARSWKLSDEVTDTAEFLLSELLTNAYRHGAVPKGREIWARCALEDDRIRMEVSDANLTLPEPQEAAPDDTSGRGLALVAALADAWAAEPRVCGIGKTVWFELRLRPDGEPSPTESARAGSTAATSAGPPRHATRPS